MIGTVENALAVWKRTMQRQSKPVTKIRDLQVTEISLVDRGANPHARIVLMKAADDPAERLDAMEARLAAQPVTKSAEPDQPPPRLPQGARTVALARAGGQMTREAWLDGLRALGAEAAAGQGITGQLDPASLLDLGLAAPGGADIVRAIQGT
jgi:hypothetical protein